MIKWVKDSSNVSIERIGNTFSNVLFDWIVLHLINVSSDRTVKAFLNVFGRLKQKVIWKTDIDLGQDFNKYISSNVKHARWLPQQDLIGNVKMYDRVTILVQFIKLVLINSRLLICFTNFIKKLCYTSFFILTSISLIHTHLKILFNEDINSDIVTAQRSKFCQKGTCTWGRIPYLYGESDTLLQIRHWVMVVE